MIRKSVTAPGFRVVLAIMFFVTILAEVSTVRAQQTSEQQSPTQPGQAQQQPETQQSSGQEASPEESASRRRAKPPAYKKWMFNVGGGASLTSGTTRTFARGGGGVAAAGVARNYSKYFGLRADVQFDNLPLRNTALVEAQASGGNDHVFSVMVDPIFNIPATKQWSGYFVVGPSYFHRSGKLDSSAATPGAACNPFWAWWGACYAGSLRLDGKFLRTSLNEYGENLGVGIARKIRPNIEVYAEFRYLHGTHNGNTTDLRPITMGVRW
jgi:hypothetical protein